jgi:hypothetical protein
MKKYLFSLLVLSLGQYLIAQNVDVRVDPQIKVDVSGITERVVSNVITNFERDFEFDFDMNIGDDDDDDDMKSKYQQSSQEVEIPLSKPGERGTLKVDSRNGRITIKGYDGATVKVKIIKYEKKVDRNTSEGGMRLVSSGGFNFEAAESNNVVEVENEGWNNRADFEIMVPKNFDIQAQTYNNGHIIISEIEGELDIESYNGSITLQSISGSASASTYNGPVKVSFDAVKADVPMTFNTYNGDVDISVPDGTKFSTKMRTNRDIYTDFENFTLSNPEPTTRRSDNRRGYSIKYENWVQGDLNGGGPEVTMKTRNGNIYIRKM